MCILMRSLPVLIIILGFLTKVIYSNIVDSGKITHRFSIDIKKLNEFWHRTAIMALLKVFGVS